MDHDTWSSDHRDKLPLYSAYIQNAQMVWMCIDICTKTPYSIVTYHPMYKIFFVQPLKHAIERNPIRPVFNAETLFNFVVCNASVFRQ